MKPCRIWLDPETAQRLDEYCEHGQLTRQSAIEGLVRSELGFPTSPQGRPYRKWKPPSTVTAYVWLDNDTLDALAHFRATHGHTQQAALVHLLRSGLRLGGAGRVQP